MLIVTEISLLLVDGDVDVLYGVFHARLARQPVMSMKHSTLGRWTVQSVHWKRIKNAKFSISKKLAYQDGVWAGAAAGGGTGAGAALPGTHLVSTQSGTRYVFKGTQPDF